MLKSSLFLKGIAKLVAQRALQEVESGYIVKILSEQNIKIKDASILNQSMIYLLHSGVSVLFWAGLYDLFQDVLIRLCRKTSQPDEYYQRTQRLRRFLVYGFQVYSAWQLFTGYGNAWINLPKNVSAFSFSFPESLTPYAHYGRFTFLDRPFVLPIFTALIVITLVYNVKEFVSNIASAQRRQGDSPFFGFMNAAALMSIGSYLHVNIHQAIASQVLIRPGMSEYEIMQAQMQVLTNNKMLSIAGALVMNLAGAGEYHVFQNLILLVTNTIYAFLPKPTIEIQDDLTRVARAPIRRRRPRRRMDEYQPAVFQVPASQVAASSVVSEAEVPDEPAGTREKVKTRGTPGPGRSDDRPVTHAKIDALPDTQYKVQSRIRGEKLDDINFYRTRSQVKTHLINKELTTLVKFLPNAKIENITGSEHALTWAWNRKKYRLKFEKPHGTHSEYQGRKLKKILNVLEAGYLWGWGHDNIQRYIKANDSSRHLGKIVAGILFGRPPLEDVSVAPRASL